MSRSANIARHEVSVARISDAATDALISTGDVGAFRHHCREVGVPEDVTDAQVAFLERVADMIPESLKLKPPTSQEDNMTQVTTDHDLGQGWRAQWTRGSLGERMTISKDGVSDITLASESLDTLRDIFARADLGGAAVRYCSGRPQHPYNITDALTVVWGATEAMVEKAIKEAKTPEVATDYRAVQDKLRAAWETLQGGTRVLVGTYPS